MMLPLWTSVTDGRWWSMAYWIAWRTSRLLPNSLTGLMPMADPGRTFLPSFSSMKRMMGEPAKPAAEADPRDRRFADPDWEKKAASTIDMATAIAQKINPSLTGARLEAAKAKAKEMCDWTKPVGFED